MRAILCRSLDGIGALTLETVADPLPAAGEVRVRVRACALNFPDLLITEGRYQVKPPLPFVPGMEFAGVIDAVGPGVTGFVSGQRVSGVVTWGAFAEAICVPVDRLAPLPDEIEFGAGAALGLAYQTVWHALKQRARLCAGETLLVLGASGGIGLAAVQLGRQLGARVIAAASSDEKLAACRAQGADHLINYRTGDLRAELKALAQSGGGPGGAGPGIDVVLDPVGGGLAEVALRALAWRGRYLVVGFAEGTVPALPLNHVLLAERDILGVYVGEYFRREPQARAALSSELLGMVARGRFAPPISAEFAFDDFGAALELLRDRRAVGKILLRT